MDWKLYQASSSSSRPASTKWDPDGAGVVDGWESSFPSAKVCSIHKDLADSAPERLDMRPYRPLVQHRLLLNSLKFQDGCCHPGREQWPYGGGGTSLWFTQTGYQLSTLELVRQTTDIAIRDGQPSMSRGTQRLDRGPSLMCLGHEHLSAGHCLHLGLCGALRTPHLTHQWLTSSRLRQSKACWEKAL